MDESQMDERARFTIEELSEYSGYSVRTLYDLTFYGILSPPIRGIDPRLYGSKGLYPACCLKQLDRYKELKLQGLRRTDIITILKLEGSTNVQVQQG